ncbi:hypothetical protein HDE77_001880 [Rhodanobacter sp. MP7CTX1]|nr:hypothetical protein [Rhodanobacter sp. MP7CTX1]
MVQLSRGLEKYLSGLRPCLKSMISGLVLLLESADGRLSLLLGDAGYKFIDPSVVARYQEQALKTLVVAHHGGLLARKAPSNVPAPDRVQGGRRGLLGGAEQQPRSPIKPCAL